MGSVYRGTMEKDLQPLMERIGVTFSNVNVLRQALVHRSYLNENRAFPLDHNERLEFLGDAVLELAVTNHLYHRFPDQPEGQLTAWRSALVNTFMIAKHAKSLGYQEFLYLSRGESQTESKKAKTAVLANAYEAVIGAMYIDQGYTVAEAFIVRDLLEPEIPRVIERRRQIDPKSALQELVQDAYNLTPHYTVLTAEGPDHDKVFTVGFFIGSIQITQGTGRSKQAAQVDAAKQALENDQWKSRYDASQDTSKVS